jgi:hypothetical protein
MPIRLNDQMHGLTGRALDQARDSPVDSSSSIGWIKAEMGNPVQDDW